MPRTSVWWRRQRSTPAGLSCNQNAAHSPQYVQSLFGCRAFMDLTYSVNISDVVAQKSAALADHYIADDAAHPQTAMDYARRRFGLVFITVTSSFVVASPL